MVSGFSDTIYGLIDFPGQQIFSLAQYKTVTVMAFHRLFHKEVLYVDSEYVDG